MKTLSLEAATTLTSWSRRTWWRRIGDGEVARVADDSRGRAMLAWEDVKSRLLTPLVDADIAILALADSGDAAAQNDIGQLISATGRYDAAIHWIRQSADQGHPDAMQHLGRAYAAGEGVEKNENIALMWIAKAASAGHIIAMQQTRSLRSS